jgi:hypothetical protein
MFDTANADSDELLRGRDRVYGKGQAMSLSRLRDRNERLWIGRRPHFDMVDARRRELVNGTTCFVTVCHANADAIDGFDSSLSLHALDGRTRFQNLPGRLNTWSDQSACRNVAPPCRDLGQIAPHIPDACHAIRHE